MDLRAITICRNEFLNFGINFRILQNSLEFQSMAVWYSAQEVEGLRTQMYEGVGMYGSVGN